MNLPFISPQGYNSPPRLQALLTPFTKLYNPRTYTGQFIVSRPWHLADPTLTYPTPLWTGRFPEAECYLEQCI